MKLIIGLILLSLSGCVSTLNAFKEINYHRIQDTLKIGVSTKFHVISVLGSPSRIDDESDIEVLNYDTPEKWQRLSIKIDKKNQKLVNYIWIPKKNEKEISIGYLIQPFDKSKFEQVVDNNDRHAVSDVILFVNKQQGITIRYNKGKDYVEAIARFEGKARDTATIK